MPPTSVQLPYPITVQVAAYKALSVEYSKITDPNLQIAYKSVLSAKYTAITDSLNSYNGAVQSIVSGLQIT